MSDFYIDVFKDRLFRKKHGVHFTSQEVVEKICSKVVSLLSDNVDWNSFKVLDLASGTGIFSYCMAKQLSRKYNRSFTAIINDNCIMVELNMSFVNKCREIYNRLNCIPYIINDDALFSDEILNDFYDVVIGNPPYIRIQNLTADYRHKLKMNYKSCIFGSSDIYYAFMELSINRLKTGGIMGLITPSSYIRTEAGKYLRELLSSHLYNIEDSGSHKYFDCDAYTAFTYIVKDNNDTKFNYLIDDHNYVIDKKKFGLKKFVVNERGGKLLLKDVCKFRGGIATLRDGIFIIKPDHIDEKFVYYKNHKIDIKSTVKLVKISELKNSFDANKQYYRCIFPYKGAPGVYKKFEDEDEFYEFFPNTYNYLHVFKHELEKRDKGVNKGYKWFEFGRTQGLSYYSGDYIVTSTMNQHPLFIKLSLTKSLFRSGIVLFDIKYDISKLLEILNSERMLEFMHINGSKYGDNWRGYSRKILEIFPIE